MAWGRESGVKLQKPQSQGCVGSCAGAGGVRTDWDSRAILNLLGPSMGAENASNEKRQGFKKLLSLALTVGMLNDALRPDQTEMDPSASKPTKT